MGRGGGVREDVMYNREEGREEEVKEEQREGERGRERILLLLQRVENMTRV